MRNQNVVITAFLLAGSVWADQIVLKGGDRITGAIVKKDGEKLTVESKNFAVVTLKWADVESVVRFHQASSVRSGRVWRERSTAIGESSEFDVDFNASGVKNLARGRRLCAT